MRCVHCVSACAWSIHVCVVRERFLRVYIFTPHTGPTVSSEALKSIYAFPFLAPSPRERFRKCPASRDMVPLSFVALSVGLLLPSPPGTLTLTRRDALAAVAATPALLARPAAAPAATAFVPAKDIESIKVSSTYSLTYLRSTGPIHTTTSAIMAIHTGARPESEGAPGSGALHRGGPAEACHGPDARLQQLPGHHRSGAARARLPRPPRLLAARPEPSHVPRYDTARLDRRQAACLSLGGARMSPSCHPCRCSAPRCRHCCRCRRR